MYRWPESKIQWERILPLGNEDFEASRGSDSGYCESCNSDEKAVLEEPLSRKESRFIKMITRLAENRIKTSFGMVGLGTLLLLAIYQGIFTATANFMTAWLLEQMFG